MERTELAVEEVATKRVKKADILIEGIKVTEKCKMIYDVLCNIEVKGQERGSAFAHDVHEALVAKGVDVTFNSVNATIAYMAGKNLVAKSKGIRIGKDGTGKFLTLYTVIKG